MSTNEARLEDLKAQRDELNKRIEELEKATKLFKTGTPVEYEGGMYIYLWPLRFGTLVACPIDNDTFIYDADDLKAAYWSDYCEWLEAQKNG